MNEKTKGIKRIRFSGNKQTNIHTYIHTYIHTENNKTDSEIVDKWVLRRT